MISLFSFSNHHHRNFTAITNNQTQLQTLQYFFTNDTPLIPSLRIILAPCVVLLVPMAFSVRYHLTRNKILFFSTLLFISLSITLHLSPFFPDFIHNPQSCLSILHQIHFTHQRTNLDKNFSGFVWVNSDVKVLACDFHHVGMRDSGVLLNGCWVMVAGDSQARLFVVSLLDLILFKEEMDPVRGDLFKRHSDYHHVVDRIGLKLDFIWAPYVSNLTDLVMDLNRNESFPDVFVMGSGLWHMLHVTNAMDYMHALVDLRGSVMSLGSGLSGSLPHLFWHGMPMLVNSMLNTQEKREKMTNATQIAYLQGLESSNLLRPRGPFMLLDIGSLSENCGVGCTEDGMHYDGVVYKASVHMMLNALLIQSQQKL